MQSRWVIIVLIVVLMAAAIIIGVWWFAENEDQVDLAATPTALVSPLDLWHAMR